MRVSILVSALLICLALMIPAFAADDLKIEIVTPQDGDFISGTVTVSVEALSGEIGLLDISIDGKKAVTLEKAPWTWSWNVDDLSVGEHVLTATAHSGDRMAEDAVTIRTGPQMKLVTLDEGPFHAGDTLVVALQVNRVTGLNGVNFRMQFDPQTLEYVGCDKRHGFDGENFLGSPLFLGTLAEENLVACNATIKKGDPLATGSGNVAYVTFRVRNEQPTRLALINDVKYVKCIDADGETLNVNVLRTLDINR